MRSAAPIALFLLALVMIAATTIWFVALHRFFRFLEGEYPEAFRQLGQPSAWHFEFGFGAGQRTSRLYRFLFSRSQDAGAPSELQEACRWLRLLFIFRWSTLVLFALAILLIAIVLPHAQNT
jgi:hypothetical protein